MGWVEGSRMRAKYVHWFSNVSNESILEAFGIVPSFSFSFNAIIVSLLISVRKT